DKLLYCLPIALALVIWLADPFARPLVEKSAPLTSLNSAQKVNIQVAAKSINGTILKPGDEFSFNRIVGPRTSERGYETARTYLDRESPLTAGGGICLLSSILYQAALESGLSIKERVAHERTIKTVAPGLDATVWYGKADLRFLNNQNYPIMISCHADPQTL